MQPVHYSQDSEAWLKKAEAIPVTYSAVIHSKGKQVARIYSTELRGLEARANRFIDRCGHAGATYEITAG